MTGHLEPGGGDLTLDDILDLRAGSLQEPPPPPREIPQRDPVPLEDTLVGLEQTRSDSPVQIAVTPPDLESMLPPVQVAPAGHLSAAAAPVLTATVRRQIPATTQAVLGTVRSLVHSACRAAGPPVQGRAGSALARLIRPSGGSGRAPRPGPRRRA